MHFVVLGDYEKCARNHLSVVRTCAPLTLSADGVASSGATQSVPATSGAPSGGGGAEVARVNAVVGRSAELACTVRLEAGDELDLANRHFLSWFRVRSPYCTVRYSTVLKPVQFPLDLTAL